MEQKTKNNNSKLEMDKNQSKRTPCRRKSLHTMYSI